ncbi:hypothetical protein HYY75_09600, partial [bacterium]|nr:hypothetical protein [bacterium]
MKYPFPISVIIHKLDETSDPIAHFIQLGNLFEVTLRFLASLTLGSLFHIREKRNIDVPEKVLTGLVKPSLGHWCQVLHSIPKCLGEAGNVPIPEILSLTIPNEQPLELTRSFHEIQIFLGKKNEGVPKKFSLAAFFDLLVAFRNKTKAHGAIQNNLSS